MQMKNVFLVVVVALITATMMVSGCAVNFYKQSPRSQQKIMDLEAQIDDLERQRAEERRELEEARRLLQGQIADKRVTVEMDERGLVIVLSDDILFDSGKAEIKADAYPVLDKVTKVIIEKVPSKNIGITGHTDNVPITYSSWASNWELSTARATNVLHYLQKKGVSPKRLSAIGYGEQRPIASNDTAAGRAKNRRVEIIILPEFVEQREEVVDVEVVKVQESNFAK